MSVVRGALNSVLDGDSLSADQIRAVLDEILDGGASPVLVAALLVGLRLKGESPEELAGGVRALLGRAVPPGINPSHLLDTAGTGGDGKGTFNISTGAALIAAAAGVRVAKHGNRAASGSVGAADLLEHLGVRIELSPAGLRHCLSRAGICFIFAPHYHPALARMVALRRELGVRTIFNLLGALANPAQPGRRLLGVGDRRFARPVAEALRQLGVEHAMVVHSEDGMDELSAQAPSLVLEIRGRQLEEHTFDPRQAGMDSAAPSDAITAGGVEQAGTMLRAALAGQEGPAQDVLALNGGAAIYLGGQAATLLQGVARAREILRRAGALATLDRLRQASWEEA